MRTDFEAFEHYLARTSGSGLTVRCYLTDAMQFAERVNGPTVEAVEEFVEFLLAQGLRPQSIRRRLAAVRRFLGWCGRSDPVARETAEILRTYKVAPPVRERDRRPHRVVTEAEAMRLIENAPTAECKALLALLWGTGARVSEILGRPLAGIPPMTGLEGKRLARGEIIERIGKGGRCRRLVLPASLRPIVGAWAESVSDDAPLFARSVQAVHRMLDGTAKRAGVPHVYPHAFRHGAKSRLEAAGVPREVLQAFMGHAPRDVTEIYGEVSSKRLLMAVA